MLHEMPTRSTLENTHYTSRVSACVPACVTTQTRGTPYASLGAQSGFPACRLLRAPVVARLPTARGRYGGAGFSVLVGEHVGVKEPLVEDETGWIVSADNLEELANRMKWCVLNPGRIRDMRDAVVRAAQYLS